MPEPENERQCLVLDPNADPALAPGGLRFITIEHEGCPQKSEPERNLIAVLRISGDLTLANAMPFRPGSTT
jgi:hypothetical protein